MYDKLHKKVCIILYAYVKYMWALREYLDRCKIKFSDCLTQSTYILY